MTPLWTLSLLLSLSHPALTLAREDTTNTPRQIADAEEDNLAGMLNPPVWPTQASVVLPARAKMVDSLPVPMGRLTPTSEDFIWKDTTDEFRGIIGEYADMGDISERLPSSFPGESQPEIPGSTDKGMTSQTDFHPPPWTLSRDRDPNFTEAPGHWTTKSNTMGTLGQNPWTLPVMEREVTSSSSSLLPSILVQTGRSPNSNSSPFPSTGVSSKGLPSPFPSKTLLLNPPMTDRAKPPVDQSASLTEEPGGSAPTLEDTGKGFKNFSQDFSIKGSVSTEKDKGRSSNEEWWNPQTNETSASPDWNVDSLTTPSNTSDQSSRPVDPDDITSKQSLHPSLVLIPPLFVPLYSDWNSAMATWGLAWEAHVYGLGSVFAVCGLISVLCLLGLPLRCPAGIPYFTVLHLLLLTTGGVRAFSLLYDAYSHQDRLPLLGSLLLSELPLACLTSAFSLSFILLSQRSRMHLSLRLSLSAPLSPLPRPWLLLGLSLLHFGASLGSVGLLQLLPNFPAVLLLPQGLFVSLCLLLSCSYLIFYCHVRADTTHIYQLRDTGEEGGSPMIGLPARCPFAEVGEWDKAAGAGVGAALCLMGCGGLQLYGILHALGLGGVSAGAGFQPWPWWGYQMGCRLCEVGVCLSLSLIGAQPLLCHTSSSSRTTSNPRPGSWSRLPCVSPSKGSNISPQAENKSPNLPPHYPWALSQQDKLVVCEVITKSQSEALPLYSLVDPPQNGPGLPSNPSHTRSSIPPLLPNPPSPPGRPRDSVDSNCSLDSLTLYSDSTVDLRPPSPIDLSRSIDQALFSETLFPHSLFSPPRLFHASSSLSLTSPSQGDSYTGPHSASSPLYRTSSCGDVDENDPMSRSRLPQPDHNRTSGSPDPCGWKGSNASSVGQASLSSSSQGLCSSPIDKAKSRFGPRVTRGQLSQSSLPRTIPHMPHHRRYRTLSSASQHSRGECRLAGTEYLSESRQLERDLAVQAEFVNVCRQIDSLSVCSDTIDL